MHFIDSFVINIGDMMQAWSNGKYRGPGLNDILYIFIFWEICLYKQICIISSPSFGESRQRSVLLAVLSGTCLQLHRGTLGSKRGGEKV